MNKETLAKAVSEFQDKNRRWYRIDYVGDLTIKKVFNHGMGMLDLFYFDLKREFVAINRTLSTSADLRKLREFLQKNKMQNWRTIDTTLGYPDWYFNHLSDLATKPIKFA